MNQKVITFILISIFSIGCIENESNKINEPMDSIDNFEKEKTEILSVLNDET